MKNFNYILLFAFFTITSVFASSTNKNNNYIAFNQVEKIKPIIFEENGMQFVIIINESARFTKLKIKHLYNTDKTKPIGITLKTDKKGRIQYANSTQILYSNNGKVAKIGTVIFSYKGNRLYKVGNLEVIKNKEGEINFNGAVRGATKTYFTKKPKIKMT